MKSIPGSRSATGLARTVNLLLGLLLLAFAAFGQSNDGSFTGETSDPANAAVANATIEANNVKRSQAHFS